MSPDPLGTALRDLVDDVEAGLVPPRGGRAVGRWAPSSPHRPPRPGRGRCVCRGPGHPRGLAERCPASLGARHHGRRRRNGATHGLPRCHRQAPVHPDDDGTGCDGRPRPGLGRARCDVRGVAGGGTDSGAAAARRVGVRRTLALARRSVGLPWARAHRPHQWGGRSRRVRTRPGSSDAWTPTAEPSWWSPDSRRVFVACVQPRGPAVRRPGVGTDGSITEVPLVAGGVAPIVAGWIDDGLAARLPRPRPRDHRDSRAAPGGSVTTGGTWPTRMSSGPRSTTGGARGRDRARVAVTRRLPRAAQPGRSTIPSPQVVQQHPRDDVRREHRCPDRDAGR